MKGKGFSFCARLQQLSITSGNLHNVRILACIALCNLLIISAILPIAVTAQEPIPDLRKGSERLADLRKAVTGGALQRFVVLPRTDVLTIPARGPSPPVRVYCLDQDLPAPGDQKIAFNHVHTPTQQFVTLGEDPPISFEKALHTPSGSTSILSVHASTGASGYQLEFTNHSDQPLSIKFSRASIFGRVEGRLDEQNSRDMTLLRLLNDPRLSNEPLLSDLIWEATARLARLRMLGFWPEGRALDAVTSDAQDSAELAAQKKLAVSATELDRGLRSEIRRLAGAYALSARLPESSANRVAATRLMHVVTIRSTPNGVVRINGIVVSQVQVRGTWYSLRAEFLNPDSRLQYSNIGCEIEARTLPFGGPPVGASPPDRTNNGRNGGPPTPPISFRLNGRDFMSVVNKAAESNCSVEYCVTTGLKGQSRVDQQVLMECNGIGYGVSTNGKVEVKVGPFSVEGP